MRFWHVFTVAVITVLLITGAIIYLSFFFEHRPNDVALQYDNAQLAFTVVSIIAVIFTLLYATYQFRKSIAEPIIDLYFDENKSRKIVLNRGQDYDLNIYAFNKGNKIAVIYQVELNVPSIFEEYLVRTREGDRLSGTPPFTDKAFRVSFYSHNHSENICFVNKFVNLGKLRIKKTELDGVQPQTLKINYSIYGDWQEPQSNVLTVEIK